MQTVNPVKNAVEIFPAKKGEDYYRIITTRSGRDHHVRVIGLQKEGEPSAKAASMQLMEVVRQGYTLFP